MLNMSRRRVAGISNMANVRPDRSVLLEQPIKILETILSFCTFDEIAHLRLVCRTFDEICQKLLNRGFLAVERYHEKCLKKIKAQLPRRESERRNHPLARHCDILTAIETRLSLLGMTYMKYVEGSVCCFIPGKVIDEIYRVLRHVEHAPSPQRSHEILQELRDISSMAMEHFEEHIVQAQKEKIRNSSFSYSPHGALALTGSANLMVTPHQSPLPWMSSIQYDGSRFRIVNVLKKDLSDMKSKMSAMEKKMEEQEKKIEDLNRLLTEHHNKIADQDSRLKDSNRKQAEYEQKMTDILNEFQVREVDIESKSKSDHKADLGATMTLSTTLEKAMDITISVYQSEDRKLDEIAVIEGNEFVTREIHSLKRCDASTSMVDEARSKPIILATSSTDVTTNLQMSAVEERMRTLRKRNITPPSQLTISKRLKGGSNSVPARSAYVASQIKSSRVTRNNKK